MNFFLNIISRKIINSSLEDNIFTKAILDFKKDDKFRFALNTANQTIGIDPKIPFRLHQLMFCIESTQNISGNIVELGTGKGYLFAGALAALHNSIHKANKEVYLFDLFSYPDQKLSGIKKYIYAKNLDEVKKTFAKYKFVKIIQGILPDSLDAHLVSMRESGICFLHVDLNHYEPEILSLKKIYEFVSVHGIILLDDYANPGRRRQYEEFNNFFREKNQTILTLASGQGLVIKK